MTQRTTAGRKVWILAVTGFVLALAAVARAEIRIAVVDMQRALNECPRGIFLKGVPFCRDERRIGLSIVLQILWPAKAGLRIGITE